VTEPEGEPGVVEHHVLVQAPVRAVDVDGLNVVSIGIVLFGVATVILAIGYADLSVAGRGWWLGVSISGLVLGLVGLAYCVNRRRRRRAGRWDRD
jgi:hypothetical protein